MAADVDPLRATLDTLALDPAAQADRPYLISMLKRLGYSDVEIAAYLGESPGASEIAEAASDDRLIEIEYTGPGLRDYTIIIPRGPEDMVDESDPFGLGAGLQAGEEVLGGGPSQEEVDALMAESALSDFDSYEVQKQEEVAVAKLPGEGDEAPALESVDYKEEDKPASETPPPEGLPGADQVKLEDLPTEPGPDFGDQAPGAPGAPESFNQPPGEEFVEFAPPGTEAAAQAAEQEFQVGEPLVEFEATPLNKATLVTPEKRQKMLERETGTTAAEAAVDQMQEPGGPYRYGDWTLYSRDVELSDGRGQRIYFFSKGEPKTGAPAELPDGYEVALSDRTGLPYLRRKSPEAEGEAVPDPGPVDQAFGGDVQRGPAKKRVRILRVSGGSKEEAERKIKEAGGDRNVIASMPIDIEQHWSDKK